MLTFTYSIGPDVRHPLQRQAGRTYLAPCSRPTDSAGRLLPGSGGAGALLELPTSWRRWTVPSAHAGLMVLAGMPGTRGVLSAAWRSDAGLLRCLPRRIALSRKSTVSTWTMKTAAGTRAACETTGRAPAQALLPSPGGMAT